MKEFAPFCRDVFLADYRWPIAAGCIRRASCSTREAWGGANGRTTPLPLETWSLIAARRFRIDCHCSQSSCRRNGRNPWMNGSSRRASPFVSGTKKRFKPTPSASEIFSSVPRLGVICPLSIRDRYDRETRERAWSWLCVIPRDSRNCRMRWPIFSTVSRFGHFSKSCRSSPGSSCGSGGGIRNSTLGGSKRRHRRQFPVRVRYCTSPQVLQRITSRSRSISTATLFPLVPFIAFVLFCSDTGAPRRLFRHADERDFVRGKGSSWRDRHKGGIRFRCQVFSPCSSTNRLISEIH